MKLGIGVCTYKRTAKLKRLLRSLDKLTHSDYTLVVADDGSDDGTIQYLGSQAINFIEGANRGVAWNKNRALFYLHAIEKCDIIVIFEDDTYLTEYGWDLPWIINTLRFGHMNYANEAMYHTLVRGDGSFENPYQSYVVGGMVTSFSRPAIDYVGYIDSRFKYYGYEHVEHSDRMVRAGYGGVEPKSNDEARHFYVLKSAIGFELDDSHQNPASLEANRVIFEKIHMESVYRSPWQTDEDMRVFRREIEAATHRSHERGFKSPRSLSRLAPSS